jgi:hypothetical protein
MQAQVQFQIVELFEYCLCNEPGGIKGNNKKKGKKRINCGERREEGTLGDLVI